MSLHGDALRSLSKPLQASGIYLLACFLVASTVVWAVCIINSGFGQPSSSLENLGDAACAPFGCYVGVAGGHGRRAMCWALDIKRPRLAALGLAVFAWLGLGTVGRAAAICGVLALFALQLWSCQRCCGHDGMSFVVKLSAWTRAARMVTHSWPHLPSCRLNCIYGAKLLLALYNLEIAGFVEKSGLAYVHSPLLGTRVLAGHCSGHVIKDPSLLDNVSSQLFSLERQSI